MSADHDNDINRFLDQMHELNLTIVKLQSHLESELGNNTRQLNDLSEKITKINHKIFGNGTEGIIIKIDRLEQNDLSRKKWERGFVAGTCVLVIKIAYDIIVSFPIS